MNNDHDVILFHHDALKDNKQKDFIYNFFAILISASDYNNASSNFDAF